MLSQLNKWQIDERGVEVNVFGKYNKYFCEKKKKERERIDANCQDMIHF